MTLKKKRVRMLVSIAGLADPKHDLEEFSFQPDQVVELHPDLAAAWIGCGHAEAVDDSVPLTGAETASIEAPEKAVMPRGAPKKAG